MSELPSAREIANDRLLTIPNALSTLRLLGVPLFLYLVLGPHADGWALIILMVSGVTDYLDGKLARMLNQTSKLGTLLDPLADRLYIASTLIALTIRGIVPLWLLIVLVLRDVALLTTVPGLRRMGFGNALPVHFLGKAATFNLLYAFPFLLATTGHNWFATACRPIAWAFALWGTALYWYAAILYFQQYRQLSADERAGRLPPPLPADPAGG
ncbi:MAG TPA: CDP-alcohol phosphatidyltransferase family protein [Frankiaceae bacterium]|nr:CDP-alcohol phosphatidyltransferase family protein [Frankiaceae bacterium]